MSNYDVIIVGAGITGAAIARELSKFKLKTLILEKEAAILIPEDSRSIRFWRPVFYPFL